MNPTWPTGMTWGWGGGVGGGKVVAITGSVVTVSAFSVKSYFYSISSIKLSVLFRGATLSDMTSGVL